MLALMHEVRVLLQQPRQVLITVRQMRRAESAQRPGCAPRLGHGQVTRGIVDLFPGNGAAQQRAPLEL